MKQKIARKNKTNNQTPAQLRIWLEKTTNRFRSWIEGVFQSKKKTFGLLALGVFTILFLIQIAIILINNSFYSNFSDDILQYYPIIVDFIRQVKAGTISLFNLNNYLGASFFSDVYYIPLDIFTLITFILSYVMPIELAYSVTEFIKILAGVMIFAYYLSLKGMKNRTVFWMGVVYFVSGGTVSFMAFPAFLSLAFYIPMSLVVIHWSFTGKKWVVPIFAFLLVFYNFYLAYTLLFFIGIMYIVEYLKRDDFHILRFLRAGVIFLFLLILGLGLSMVILYPSILFIIEDTYRTSGSFTPWIVNVFGREWKLFKPEIYFRFLGKIFAETRPIAFYGFAQDYTKEHVSLYITMTGLVLMSYIYFMRDRISRVYKFLIPFGIILAFFPLFSTVFSGSFNFDLILAGDFSNLGIPYTRWINFYPFVMVLILAHVFDHHGFETYKMKWMSIPIVSILALAVFVILHYAREIPKLIDLKAGGTPHLADPAALTADAALMGVSALVIVLMLVFGWLGKQRWFRFLFWIECIVSLVFIYTGPFYIRGKIDTFSSMSEINTFLNAHIEGDEFFRVYVDLDRFNTEKTNFNRMTTFPTNTKIFHSWTDKETDLLADVLFGRIENQSKDALEVQAIYLNQFLGYKYILASSEYSYYLDSDIYQLVAANDKFQLLEIVNHQGFHVYESFVSTADFKSMRQRNNKVEAQKVLLQAALIDAERYDTSQFNLEENSEFGSSYLKSVSAYQTVSNPDIVTTSGVKDASERSFYRFTGSNFNVGISSGGMYIKTSVNFDADNDQILDREVFIEFSDGSRMSCKAPDSLTAVHDIDVAFGAEPVAIYFEASGLPAVFSFRMRLELARDYAAYLVYDLSKIDYSRDQGMLYFELSQPFERVFILDEDGNEYEGFKNYYYFASKPVQMYVYKTYDMYTKVNDLFNFSLSYAYDDLSTFETSAGDSLAANKHLTINQGKIHLTYQRTSDSTYDQIVVIPVAYSEEWKITSGQTYDTLSAGGFLGIVVPHGVDTIDLQLKFVPKGLSTGFLVTAGATLIYLGIFLPGWIIAAKRRKKSKELIVT